MAQPLKVLCVEDNNDDVLLLIAELRRSGYEVDWQTVVTEDTYVDALRQSPPDIILCDYSMPDFNGLTALKLLVAAGYDIPFIIISAKIGEEMAVEAMRLGAADYLFKDRTTRLGQAVAGALHAHYQRAEQRHMQKLMRFQLEVQRIIVAISTRFLGIAPSQLDQAIENSLRDVGQCVDADYAQIFLFSLDLKTITRTYTWRAPQAAPLHNVSGSGDSVAAILYTSMAETLRNGQMVYAPRVQDMPAEAAGEKASLEADGVQSVFVAPLLLGEVLVGAFALTALHTVFNWSADELTLFRMLADVFANVVLRTQSETILHNERNLLRELINTVPDPITARGLDGRIILANTAAAEIIGTFSMHMLNMRDIDLYPPELAHSNLAAVQTVWRTRRPSPEYEEMLLDPMGHKRWLLTTHAPLLDAFGEITGAVTINHDITQRTLATEQLKRQLDTIKALYEAARGLTSLDLQTLLDEATLRCVESFGAKLAWVGQAEPDGRVRPISQFPQEIDYPRSITVRWDDTPAGRGPTGTSINKRSPVIERDLATTPNDEPWHVLAQRAGFAWSGAFPLVSHNYAYGALMVYFGDAAQLTDDRVQFFESYSRHLAAAVENAWLYEQTEGRLQQVQALHEIANAISGSFEQGVTFNVILDAVMRLLHVDSAAMLLLDADTQTLSCAAQRGFRTDGLTSVRVPLDRSNAGLAVLEHRIVNVHAGDTAGGAFLTQPPLVDEGFETYYGIQLSTRGRVLGVLEVYQRTALDPAAEWLKFFEALAAQAAVAVETYAKIIELQNTNKMLAKAWDATIEGWSSALELRDRETAGHAQRVVDLTLRVAAALGMNDAALVHVRRGALLHDIGKLGIPDNILLKAGALSEDEWCVMRKHVQYAYDLLMQIPYLIPAIDIPYCHHERWDGAGYPRGQKGQEIPLTARIFAVVDSWDALRHDRPYRAAWLPQRIRDYLQEESGSQFDPHVLEVFLQITRDE